MIIEFARHPPVLRCEGDEDRTTQCLRRRALAQALSAEADVVVDFSGLAFTDYSLMVDLAVLSRRLRRRGRALRLSGGAPQIWAVIRRVGLHRLPGVRLDEAAFA